MLRRVLDKVEDGRFSRALAGLQAGWQWEPDARVFSDAGDVRQVLTVHGFVTYSGKRYEVAIQQCGRGYRCRCSCSDHVRRGVLCMHIAFAAMSELGLAAAARSAHRQLPELG